MEKLMRRDDVIDELHERTGFYKKNLRDVMAALEDIIVENMTMATIDEPSEVRPFFGWKIGAKVIPEHQAKDPRNGEIVTASERFSPYCRFAQNFKMHLNEEYEEEIDDE